MYVMIFLNNSISTYLDTLSFYKKLIFSNSFKKLVYKKTRWGCLETSFNK
jgi:hypothetical protein